MAARRRRWLWIAGALAAVLALAATRIVHMVRRASLNEQLDEEPAAFYDRELLDRENASGLGAALGRFRAATALVRLHTQPPFSDLLNRERSLREQSLALVELLSSK